MHVMRILQTRVIDSIIDRKHWEFFSIYRRCDIESLVTRLEQAGHHIEPLDFSKGATFVDGYVDPPPYRSEPHLRLRIGEYACTSIGLIITGRPGVDRVDRTARS
jgi:hypothetical protein